MTFLPLSAGLESTLADFDLFRNMAYDAVGNENRTLQDNGGGGFFYIANL